MPNGGPNSVQATDELVAGTTMEVRFLLKAVRRMGQQCIETHGEIRHHPGEAIRSTRRKVDPILRWVTYGMGGFTPFPPAPKVRMGVQNCGCSRVRVVSRARLSSPSCRRRRKCSSQRERHRPLSAVCERNGGFSGRTTAAATHAAHKQGYL
jgi:hypothetical protein